MVVSTPLLLKNTMIRRVAAMPGDELVAFEGEEHEETFVVPQARYTSLCAPTYASASVWQVERLGA